MKFNYDVIVVGAGHAGCEAAAASANMGAKTCLITIDMNKIAQMSCNPAIGGIAKGQIIREIDALGGYSGIVTDRSSIQFRMLNTSKGAAMWSPRAQCDREQFIHNWRVMLDNTPNLNIWQDQVKEIIIENNEIVGVRTWWDVEFYAKSVIITAGTFLNGLMHIGRNMLPGGRCSEPAETSLTASIAQYGIQYGRMKTGTPIRIDKRSVHFEDMEEQPVEMTNFQFSYYEKRKSIPQIPCWITYTNKECHDILRSGFNDSPLYNGQIQSIGPRYCPSIETKLTTFPDKEQHHLFLEPEGSNTNEMYLNGFSSSLPVDIQLNALKTIPAFRDIQIYRPGYAIEYDYFIPTQLKHTLESRVIKGLFFAGQVNGTTGYEEAAGQGIIAGINAALHCTSDKEFILRRDEAYIGVLIDDLVLKGVDEPYRMFTSRAEHRLLLRQDNADERLTEKSYNIGLASEERYNKYKNEKKGITDNTIQLFETTMVKPQEVNDMLIAHNTATINESTSIAQLLTRPDIDLKFASEILKKKTLNDDITIDLYNDLDKYYSDNKDELIINIETKLKYKHYIERQQEIANKAIRLENIIIKDKFDYDTIKSLTIEARQKLKKYNPNTIGEASRIPGISPSDINVLLIMLGR